LLLLYITLLYYIVKKLQQIL